MNIVFNVKSINGLFLVAAFFLILPLTAVGSVDLNVMMRNLQDSAQGIVTLTTAVGYVIGIWLIVSALMELKKVGQQQSSVEHGMGGPLMRIALGVALIYFPSTLDVALVTLWGNNSILAYAPDPTDPFAQAKVGATILVRAVGYVSFVRGFVVLSHSTHQGAQQGTVGKGVLYIIGGVLAINITATIEVIRNSLGITS